MNASSNCPHCAGSVGYWNLLMLPPRRTFECAKCRQPVTSDPDRAVTYVGILFVTFAGIWIFFGLPENLTIWHFLGGSLVAVLPYPLFAKVEAA